MWFFFFIIVSACSVLRGRNLKSLVTKNKTFSHGYTHQQGLASSCSTFLSTSTFINAQLGPMSSTLAGDTSVKSQTHGLTNQTCGAPSGLNGPAVCSNASAALTKSCRTQIHTLLRTVFSLCGDYSINTDIGYWASTLTQSRWSEVSLPPAVSRRALASSTGVVFSALPAWLPGLMKDRSVLHTEKYMVKVAVLQGRNTHGSRSTKVHSLEIFLQSTQSKSTHYAGFQNNIIELYV